MYVERYSATVTTDASGDATAYLPGSAGQTLSGRIVNVIYTKVDYADTVDFTLTVESTGQSVWAQSNVTASAAVAPRQPTHGQDGSASLYAATGEPVEDHIYISRDRLKIVVDEGGNATSGTFTVIVG